MLHGVPVLPEDRAEALAELTARELERRLRKFVTPLGRLIIHLRVSTERSGLAVKRLVKQPAHSLAEKGEHPSGQIASVPA